MPEVTIERTVTMKDFDNKVRPSWCPGCGDFAILTSLKRAFVEQGIAPHEVVVVGGIGCGSKLPDYIRAYGFMTIHGRPLPVATGIKLANPELHVVVTNGDGDGYGIGGNHFMHTCRRNPDITHIVENNQIYALTKGQYSPTSEHGFVTTTSPEGAIERAVNPAALALSAGATFIARAFSGDPKHLTEMIIKGMQHKGYALIDVLQPCVTFNKVNTYDWYDERSYKIVDEEPDYDPTNLRAAWEKANEWGDRIPLGVIYQRADVPTYEEQVPGLADGSVVPRSYEGVSKEAFDRIKLSYT